MDAVYAEVLAAEDKTGKHKISTYGPIIHNEVVVDDLKSRGVNVIQSEDEISNAADGTIVIRSHGVPKALYEKIKNSAVETVDTTCTFVKRIHEIVDSASQKGEQVVIIGNHGHAESEGHLGWASGPATIIETAEEAENYDGNKETPVTVVAQTTFNGDKFEELVAILQKNGYNVHDMNTICNATRERQQEAKELAAKADIMIVIGGKGSSNTTKLFDICRGECAHTYFIQTVHDLHLELQGGERLIGITAGASTPKNIIEEVQKDVRRTDF